LQNLGEGDRDLSTVLVFDFLEAAAIFFFEEEKKKRIFFFLCFPIGWV